MVNIDQHPVDLDSGSSIFVLSEFSDAYRDIGDNMLQEQSDVMSDLRLHIEKAVIEKANKDTGFRERLKSDPHAALGEVLERENPLKNLKINVIEEKPGEATIVLRAPFKLDELPDELLDLASGGVSFSAFVLYGPPYPDSKPK
jgi:hypothetical protein